jgi:hypothetical protein
VLGEVPADPERVGDDGSVGLTAPIEAKKLESTT